MSAAALFMLLASKPLTEQFITHTLVTPLGNMTGQGGLSAAYTTDTPASIASGSGAGSPGSSISGSGNTIGSDWGVGNSHIIERFKYYGPTDSDIVNTFATTLKLEGSNDNSSWTALTGNITVATGHSKLIDVLSASITQTTAYRYHRINLAGDGAHGSYCSALQFFELR